MECADPQLCRPYGRSHSRRNTQARVLELFRLLCSSRRNQDKTEEGGDRIETNVRPTDLTEGGGKESFVCQTLRCLG